MLAHEMALCDIYRHELGWLSAGCEQYFCLFSYSIASTVAFSHLTLNTERYLSSSEKIYQWY